MPDSVIDSEVLGDAPCPPGVPILLAQGIKTTTQDRAHTPEERQTVSWECEVGVDLRVQVRMDFTVAGES